MRDGRTGWGQRVAAGLGALAIGVGLWAQGAGSALAPEPAKLRAGLAATTSASASAFYVNGGQATTVRYYPSSFISDPYGPAAGTPCSTTSLATDATTTQVIQARGAYRRCV